LSAFLYALKAPETKRQYPRRLKVFLDFLKLDGTLEQQSKEFLARAKQNPQWAQHSLMQFIILQKERARKGEISYSTIANYYKATKLFVEMNSDALIINWKRITRGIPSGRKAANDRAPTLEEIRKLSEYPDRRIKPIVYIMASSGIRIGAWDSLQWKHVTPITNDNGEVIAAKLLIYPGDSEEYYCFITPEAYTALKDWMDYRLKHGENITSDSWLMRDLWQTTEMNYGAKFGVATYPKKLKSSGIKSLLERIFATAEELEEYLKRARNETFDTLFSKIKSVYKIYVNTEEHYITILAADTIYSYFQDKFPTVHYNIFVGDNGSGKNSALLVYKYLGYRVFYVTAASAPNYFTFLGEIEECQGTIAEDEADDMAFNKD
jgi:hypothetical protein